MAKQNYRDSFISQSPAHFDIAGAINTQEQLNQNQRQEIRQIELQNEARAFREREWQEKFFKDNFEQQDFIDIGEANLNTFYSKTIEKAMNEAGMLAMKGAREGLTPEERVKLQMLNQTSKRLKALSAPVGDVVSKINNGEVHTDPNLNNFFKNIANGEVEFDEKGELYINIPGEKESKKYSFSEMMKGVEGFNLIPKVDVLKITDEVAKGLKANTKTYHHEYEDITTKGIDPELARNHARTILFGSPDGTIMTNATKSWLKENGYDLSNPNLEALASLEDLITERIVNSQEREDIKKLDRSAKAADERNAETRRHNRITESIQQQNANTSRMNAETSRIKLMGDSGAVITNPDSNVFKSAKRSFGELSQVIAPNKPLNIGTLNVNGTNYQDVKIYGLAYDKNGRAVVEIDSETLDDLGNKSRVKTAVRVSKMTEDRIAQQLGVSSEDLKQNLMPNKPKIDY